MNSLSKMKRVQARNGSDEWKVFKTITYCMKAMPDLMAA